MIMIVIYFLINKKVLLMAKRIVVNQLKTIDLSIEVL